MPINASGAPILSGRSGRDIRQTLQKIRNQSASASDVATAFQAIQEQIDVLQGALLQQTPGPQSVINVTNAAGSITGFLGDFIGNNAALQSPAGFSSIYLGAPNTTGNPQLVGTVIPLTSAQILGMSTSSIILIPATGGTTTAVIHSALFKFTAGTSVYTGGGAVTITYGGSVAAASGSMPASAITTSGISTYAFGPLTGSSIPPNSNVEIASAGTFSAGNGTATVAIIYSIFS